MIPAYAAGVESIPPQQDRWYQRLAQWLLDLMDPKDEAKEWKDELKVPAPLHNVKVTGVLAVDPQMVFNVYNDNLIGVMEMPGHSFIRDLWNPPEMSESELVTYRARVRKELHGVARFLRKRGESVLWTCDELEVQSPRACRVYFLELLAEIEEVDFNSRLGNLRVMLMDNTNPRYIESLQALAVLFDMAEVELVR